METIIEKPTTAVVKIDPKEFGLEESKATEVESVFAPVIAERNALTTMYQEIITKEITKELTVEAGDLRKKLVKIRTNTDRIHKATKAFYLAGGRFVDAWKNKNNVVVEHMEEKLSEIENYYDNLEKKRIADLQKDRLAEITPFVDPLFLPTMTGLGEMSDAQYSIVLLGHKTAHENKIKAEKEAEEARIKKENTDKLHNTRKNDILNFWQFVTEEERLLNFGETSNDDWLTYTALLQTRKEDNDKKILEEAKKVVKEEVVQEVKREVREEVKAEVKKEIKQEFKSSASFRTEIKKEIGQEDQEKLDAAPDKEKIKDLIKRLDDFEYPSVKTKKAKHIVTMAQLEIAKVIDNLNQSSSKL